MMLCEDGLEAVLGTHRRHLSSLVWGVGGLEGDSQKRLSRGRSIYLRIV